MIQFICNKNGIPALLRPDQSPIFFSGLIKLGASKDFEDDGNSVTVKRQVITRRGANGERERIGEEFHFASTSFGCFEMKTPEGFKIEPAYCRRTETYVLRAKKIDGTPRYIVEAGPYKPNKRRKATDSVRPNGRVMRDGKLVTSASEAA